MIFNNHLFTLNVLNRLSFLLRLLLILFHHVFLDEFFWERELRWVLLILLVEVFKKHLSVVLIKSVEVNHHIVIVLSFSFTLIFLLLILRSLVDLLMWLLLIATNLSNLLLS